MDDRKSNIVGPRDIGERVNGGDISTLPFQMRATGEEVLFHENILGTFTVHQYRIEINLLQLFAHRENSEVFVIISVITFEIKTVANKTSIIANDFFVYFCTFLLISTLLLPFPTLLLLWRP